MEYIKNYESDEEQDTNMQVPDTEVSHTKPCKCGSILHKRTSHKSCPLYKKKEKKVRNTRRNEDDEAICDYCEDEFPQNRCFRCDEENICERCEGYGGDYGENEEWVCNRCLPTCLVCGDKLDTVDEECCGGGRSDENVADGCKN